MPSYDHIYVLFVLVKSSPFTGFFKWVTWRWSKNCFTLLKLLNSSSVHDGCHWWSKNCFTLLKQLNSSSVFSCISSYSIFNFLYIVFTLIIVCLFPLFPLVIVFSVLRFSSSDYSFGIFKHFCLQNQLW